MIVALDGVIRPYAWGSPTAIPALLGVPPTGEPAAELWLGAHPDDPAEVPARDTTLDKLIAADPSALLGAEVVERFGPQLPFLVKILAPARSLSMQVHPTLPQARAGFASEEARGLPHFSPDRNYRDANHKPELLCALTDFEVLCGFRAPAETVRLLDAFDVPQLAPVRNLLAGPDGLRAAFTYLLTLPDPRALVTAVRERAPAIAGEWAGAAHAVTLTGEDFPDDVGAVLALLLNYVRLAPGEAVFLAPGNVHAHLRGTGVEIMANSDNVLRCGLTEKHIDVPELVKITDFSALAHPRCPAEPDDVGNEFHPPVDDFSLTTVRLDPDRAPSARGRAGQPYIVLCASGAAEVASERVSVALTPGRAAFISAGKEPLQATGSGEVFLVTVGD